MLQLTYLSHSSFILDDGDHRLIIDPFITGNPTCPRSLDDVAVQFIVLTHAHGDHLGDAVALAARHDALIIAVNELANYVADKGARAHNMHIGGAFHFAFGRLKFTIAHHGSASPEGLYMGEPAGVVITMGGHTVYHTGDTGLFLDMQLIGQRDRIDCMCAPIGDNYTMGVDDAVIAVDFVKPRLAIPMHYNTFDVIEADPHAFVAGVTAKGYTGRVMEFGETITL
ncbi:MAG: metal-dependent hydrolase [Bacteroidota bacterium]|jgi:L-ascorbate metabolism protein UlaG (beta-lactamase superfamily)|nr:metal-dependent hydrolase [Bacteroidota bacterium]